MLVNAFDYELPAERIAQEPIEPRDHSRLLVLERESGSIHHRRFHEIGEFLRPGDALVVNDTRVMPARLVGRRSKTGGRWEGLFVGRSGDCWEFMTKTRGRPDPGERIKLDANGVELELVDRTERKTWLLRPSKPIEPEELLERAGHTPLPPYIRGGVDRPVDKDRYQTVYAKASGSIAAPTAGLHFTPELLARLEASGIARETLTLHVGRGTFLPIQVERTEDHVLYEEWCSISAETVRRLLETRRRGGRIVAVGTTSVRTLESVSRQTGSLVPFCGTTDFFITPPYAFRAVDAILTNFHLPRSTQLMLVSAFAGKEKIFKAYKEAIRRHYRFYSYGDAMLIL